MVFITSDSNYYLNSGGVEDIFLDSLCIIDTTYDRYDSFSVSGFVITGNALGAVNYALSVNTNTSSGFDAIAGLVVTPYTVV
jgi:hypothetical protein